MWTPLKRLIAALRFPSVDGTDWDLNPQPNKAERAYLETSRNAANLEHRQRQIDFGYFRRGLRA